MRKRLVALLALVVAAGLALTGCSSGGASSVTIAVNLHGGKPTQVQRVEVQGGGTVKLSITSDTDEIVHVHGYEIQFNVPAGQTVEKTFVADQFGTYEIETHKVANVLVQLVVR